jgi:hypothetical protein
MKAAQLDLENLQVSGFLTEFDWTSDGTPLMDAADYYMQSWMKWEYKEFIRTYIFRYIIDRFYSNNWLQLWSL